MGAGAMGCLYGALLGKAGEEVWLVEARADVVQAIKEKGVTLSYLDGKEEAVRIQATSDATEVGIADLVLFLVKSSDTANAAQKAVPMVGPNTYALTLQNGIGNAEAIMEGLGVDRVIYGMTLFGGSLRGPGRVEVEAPAGSRVVAYIGDKRKSRMRHRVAQVFSHAGIRTEVSDEIDRIIWTKMPLACGSGMLSALTRLRVGDLLLYEEGKDLLRLVTEECVSVANAKGIEIDLDETMKLVFSTVAAVREHTSSMFVSFLNRTKTEVGSLNEAVAKEAEKLGISAPVNRTVGLLVRVIEQSYDRQIGVSEP